MIPSFFAGYSKKQPFQFCKCIRKLYCEQIKLHCPPRCQNVQFNQFQFLHFIAGWRWNVAMDPMFFTYQHVDCFYTLFKYRFSWNIVVNSGQVFDNVQGAVYFNQRNRGMDRLLSIAKNGILQKKYRKAILELLPKDKVNENLMLSFSKRIERVTQVFRKSVWFFVIIKSTSQSFGNKLFW